MNHGLKKIFKFLKHFIIFIPYTKYNSYERAKTKVSSSKYYLHFIQNKMGGPKELLKKNSEISEIDPNQQIDLEHFKTN